MRSKRATVGFLSLVAVLAAGACSASVVGPDAGKNAPGGAVERVIEASWAESYDSLAQMARASDVVVGVTITGVDSLEIIASDPADPKFDIPMTVFRVRVDEPIDSGMRTGKEILVNQTGGTHTGVHFYIEDDPMMEVGDTAVLFLEEDEAKPGTYSVLGGPTGRLVLDDDSVRVLPGGLIKDAPSGADALIDALRQLKE